MFDTKKREDFTTKYLAFCTDKTISSLSREEAEQAYPLLIQLIWYHNWQYYIKSTPTISDGQYDMLFQYIKDIETKFPNIIRSDSPTQRLIHQVQSDFSQAHHKTPLLSLENSYNAHNLGSRNDSIKKILQKIDITEYSFLLEPKYDGVTLELIYQDGELKQAITRGDGYIGEDVTANIKTILAIPLLLKSGKGIKTLRVRGELVMSKKALERINIERAQQGDSEFVNVRNAASWSIRQLDTSITAKRWLDFNAYEILEIDLKQQKEFFANEEGFQTDVEALHRLETEGFHMHTRHKNVQTIEEVMEICESIATKNYFDTQDIAFDGIVVKIQELAIRTMLGETNHHPRWAMAYKFPTQQITTKLLSIDYQVGRTGVITPAGNLKPVELWWVTISRASLHNFDFITEKDIRIGDRVWLQRSGEVIPYIIAPVIERRTGEEIPVTIPSHCPICQGPIEKGKSDIFIYCVNLDCPAKLKEQLLYTASRDAFNIEWLGDALVDLLIEKWLVRSLADLYSLEEPQARLQLLSQAGVGQKKYHELVEEIKKTKNAPLRRLLNGLGIMHIGKKTAQLIIDAISEQLTQEDYTNKNKDDFTIQTLTQFLCDEEFLKSIKGIWPEIIASLKEWFSNLNNQAMLERMSEKWVQRNNFANKRTLKGKLTGTIFCITGTFALPRKIIADVLSKHGALVTDILTKQTNFLLVGEDPSSKLTKAQEEGITIIDWLARLEQKFDFLKNDIGAMQLFAKRTKDEKPKQGGLFG